MLHLNYFIMIVLIKMHVYKEAWYVVGIKIFTTYFHSEWRIHLTTYHASLWLPPLDHWHQRRMGSCWWMIMDTWYNTSLKSSPKLLLPIIFHPPRLEPSCLSHEHCFPSTLPFLIDLRNNDRFLNISTNCFPWLFKYRWILKIDLRSIF